MTVLDTNVLSEPLRPAPAASVLRWLAALDRESVFVTAISEAEVLYGIELLPAGKRRNRLHLAAKDVFRYDFSGRILPFDEEAALMFPKILAERERSGCPISQFDALIASICRARNAAIATRNVADFENCGLTIINPWIESG